MKRKILILGLLCISLLSACGISNPFGRDPLQGTSWDLVTINGHPPVRGSHITISFENGRVSGNSGCNNYGGEYKVSGDRIEIGVLETTLMACADPAMMDQEGTFTRFLGEAERFEITAGKLQLFAAGGESLYLLPAQASYSYP